jgi:hypothetical protein
VKLPHQQYLALFDAQQPEGLLTQGYHPNVWKSLLDKGLIRHTTEGVMRATPKGSMYHLGLYNLSHVHRAVLQQRLDANGARATLRDLHVSVKTLRKALSTGVPWEKYLTIVKGLGFMQMRA